MEKLIDLHLHTNYSDGELEPIDVFFEAQQNNVGTMAITDHDELGGIKELREKYQEHIRVGGMNLINGIEMSAQVPKGTLHILGYGIDIYNKELNDKLDELRTNSYYAIVSYLNDLKINNGIKFSHDQIRSLFNQRGNLGRPQIAELLVENKIVNNPKEAFDLYLIKMYERLRDVNTKPSSKECINLIHKAGGLAVLAHPYQLKLFDHQLEHKVEELVSYGLDGIELYYSNHTKEQIEYYKKLIEKYNLLYTVGSDYHGSHLKPDIEIGHGIDNNLNKTECSLVKRLMK